MRVLLGLAAIPLTILLTACNMTDDKTVNEDITPASDGTAKIDAEFKFARVPSSFAPIKAIKGHTTWGSTFLSYSAGYSATQQDVEAFLQASHARKDSLMYRTKEGCPPAPPAEPSPAAPTALMDLWMGYGILDRCATIESWYLPNSELKHDKATSGIYREYPPPNVEGGHRTNVVISVSLPESSQS
ncbi:hypothetical protein [Mycobacterium sp. 141]|uniref:hypothetical protein n=1 Tax=Mycobacterium sp. 141 TaxID=1120797 RepID=UPI0003634A30|nr:hypothetical protein [Mycobacterium sp. 141]